jgi:hypothetical protein
MLTVSVSGLGVLFGFFVPPHLVMMSRLEVVVRGGMVVRRSLVVVLRSRMLMDTSHCSSTPLSGEKKPSPRKHSRGGFTSPSIARTP